MFYNYIIRYNMIKSDIINKVKAHLCMLVAWRPILYNVTFPTQYVK